MGYGRPDPMDGVEWSDSAAEAPIQSALFIP